MEGGAVTQPPMAQMTWNFACEDLLRIYFDFCSSQCHMTSIEANSIWWPDQVWPLLKTCDLGTDKNQNKRAKDPHIQNFMSFGPLGAELQHPSQWNLLTLLPPFVNKFETETNHYKKFRRFLSHKYHIINNTAGPNVAWELLFLSFNQYH